MVFPSNRCRGDAITYRARDTILHRRRAQVMIGDGGKSAMRRGSYARRGAAQLHHPNVGGSLTMESKWRCFYVWSSRGGDARRMGAARGADAAGLALRVILQRPRLAAAEACGWSTRYKPSTS